MFDVEFADRTEAVVDLVSHLFTDLPALLLSQVLRGCRKFPDACSKVAL